MYFYQFWCTLLLSETTCVSYPTAPHLFTSNNEDTFEIRKRQIILSLNNKEELYWYTFARAVTFRVLRAIPADAKAASTLASVQFTTDGWERSFPSDSPTLRSALPSVERIVIAHKSPFFSPGISTLFSFSAERVWIIE